MISMKLFPSWLKKGYHQGLLNQIEPPGLARTILYQHWNGLTIENRPDPGPSEKGLNRTEMVWFNLEQYVLARFGPVRAWFDPVRVPVGGDWEPERLSVSQKVVWILVQYHTMSYCTIPASDHYRFWYRFSDAWLSQ